jgi:hypothetical protein
MKAGLLKKYQHDDYGLTPAGYEVVMKMQQDNPLA